MLRLVESFLSIQGEGKYAGSLAFFIRFAGCNLACPGFGVEQISPKNGEILVGCDTLRAVKISHFNHLAVKFDDLTRLVANLDPKTIIVITGGEPLLNHQNSDFIAFIKCLLEAKFEVHFETNGTIFVDFDKFEFYKKCKFCVSPKLKISGENYEKRINKKALRAIFENSQSFYKFVLANADENELCEIEEILSIATAEVFCMPLGKNKSELAKNAKKVAEFCIKHGFNYTDRLHIRIWNDKEGV